MIDPDLKTQLDQINLNLASIEKKKNPGVWRAFFNGMFGALGYIAGIAIIIVIIGWILQRTGQLAAFQAQVKDFSDVISQAKKLTTPADNTQPANNRGESTVILPDGRQIKVQIPQ